MTKALIRMRGCAGWSAPVLMQTPEDRFSRVEAHIISKHMLLFLLADVHDGNKAENSTSNLTYAVASPVRMSDLIEAKVTPEYEEVKDTTNARRTILSDDQTDEEELETDMENEAVDDTYYNTASKRVAVNTLADYVKSKTSDELTEEFQVSLESLPEMKTQCHPTSWQANHYDKYDKNMTVSKLCIHALNMDSDYEVIKAYTIYLFL